MIETQITSTPTKIIEQVLRARDISFLTLGLVNKGSQPLSSFEIRFKVEKNGEEHVWYSSSSDWTSPPQESFIRSSNGDPTTLAAGDKVAFFMDGLNGWYSIILVASTSSSSTTLTLEIGGE